MKYLSVPARIVKAEIGVYHELVGVVNEDEIMIGHLEFIPGALEFAGFAGACSGGQNYEGVFRFKFAAPGSTAQRIKFARFLVPEGDR